MEYYITTILGFITGGGISTVLTLRYFRKGKKLDYADKAINFMEEIQNKMNQRISDLEARINSLEQISCVQLNCDDRDNPYKQKKR